MAKFKDFIMYMYKEKVKETILIILNVSNNIE